MQHEETILYDIVLKRAKCMLIAITGKSGIERMLIHLGDRKGHNSTRTKKRLDEFQVTLLPHPPHSLDISSSDFSSFSWAMTQCEVNNSKRQKLFECLRWISAAIWNPARVSQCTTNTSQNLNNSSA
jgi:hypothetical protein